MPAKPRPVADMLAELEEELSRGKVYEAELKARGQIVYGLCDYETGAITVDPVPYTVEVLLHELVHRRWPSWSERRVEREAHRLVCSLTRRQLLAWHRRWLAVRKKRRPIDTDADE